MRQIKKGIRKRTRRDASGRRLRRMKAGEVPVSKALSAAAAAQNAIANGGRSPVRAVKARKMIQWIIFTEQRAGRPWEDTETAQKTPADVHG